MNLKQRRYRQLKPSLSLSSPMNYTRLRRGNLIQKRRSDFLRPYFRSHLFALFATLKIILANLVNFLVYNLVFKLSARFNFLS